MVQTAAQLSLRWVSLRVAGTCLASLIALAGCVPPDLYAPGPPARSPVPTAPPASTTTAPASVPERLPESSGSVEPSPPVRAVPPVSPAARTLLAESRGHQAAGRNEQAAASIERALRIEPRQPVLWLELGNIRLREGDYAQAESLGRKALSLSSGDAALEARAERLISAARQR